jgi:hypothetical protein
MTMATTITINGELRLDQSSDLQDDDFTVTNTLNELNADFRSALLALAGSQILTTEQKDFAADVGGASRDNDYVTVDSDGADVNDLFFSDPDGQLFDGDQVFIDNDPLGDPLQTVDGDNIYLWSVTGNLVIATTSENEGEGKVVAAFYLDEEDDHLSAGVEMVSFIALAHPDTGSTDETVDWSDLLNISASGSVSFDFDNLESGNFLWAAVGSDSAGLLVTGQDLNVNDTAGKLGDIVKGGSDPSDSVNTSQGGINATIGVNSQHFVGGPKVAGVLTDGPVAVFTLVRGYTPLEGAEQATGINVNQIDYDSYINTNSAAIFLSQTTGGATTKFTISLFEAGGGDDTEHAIGDLVPEEGYSGANSYIGNQDTDSHLHDDTPVNVESVTIGADTWLYNEANIATGVTKNGVTVKIVGNDITVIGADTGDTVEFTALNDAGDPDDGTFNRFTVQGLAGTGAFDIGRIDLSEGITVSEPVGDTMFVDDDGPSLPPATEDVLELVTDDDDVDIPGTDTLSTDDIFTGSPDFGTDGPSQIDPILYSLRVEGTDPASGLVDTETGKAILLQEEAGGDVVGIVDEDGSGAIDGSEALVAVRWSLSVPDPNDLDTETVTFTQYRAVVHDDPTDPDEDGLPGSNPTVVNTDLVFIDQTAIDGDEDPSGVVSFDLGKVTQLWDDGPSIGPIDNAIVAFAAGETANNSLNGDVGEDPNAAPYALTSWTTDLDINGVHLEAVANTDKTVVGYWADTNGDTIFGNSGDTEFYRLTLDDQGGAGDYTFEVFVNPPGSNLNFDFTDLPSGQNLFGCIAADKSDLDGAALFVIAKNADINDPGNGQMTNTSATVNTSKGGGPVTIGNTNQMIDPNEGTFFAYVSNPDNDMVAGVPGGLTQNSADDADNIGFVDTDPATTAEVEIVQVQGGSPADMNIKAYDIDMTAFGAGGVNTQAEARGFAEHPLTNADPVNVSGVRVYDDNGVLIESWSDANFDGNYDHILDDPNVDVVFTDLGGGIFYATVKGVQDDYAVQFDTEVEHDLALIEGVKGKFDIGGFNIVNTLETPDQKLDFTAKVTDGDGDTDGGGVDPDASWSIGIDGDGDNLVSGVII